MDKTLATLLGKISQYIYAPSQADLPGLGGPKATLIHDNQSPPTSFAGVLRYLDKTVLVFQGTITAPSIQSVKDWLQNFRALLLRELGLPGLVHAGFAGQLKLIWDDVLKELARGFTPPLYVTGHSQGGAVAALATKALELARINVTATYTFAAPRPGDATFASSVETPVFRLEFGDDIVPHVPFRGVSLGPLEKAAATFPELQQLLTNAGIRDTLGYVSVGVLTYGTPEKPLRADVSPATEQVLFAKRAAHLLLGRQNLFLHHLMPNYIAMVG